MFHRRNENPNQGGHNFQIRNIVLVHGTTHCHTRAFIHSFIAQMFSKLNIFDQFHGS